jgi:hypothetical protein
MSDIAPVLHAVHVFRSADGHGETTPTRFARKAGQPEPETLNR